ncbi:LysR family transcriptional regulator [Actinomadura macrotermitis]|uniref:Hca operon transcriptional activator HcaR n=1 Tax=Actinomadura macrotermitis TaxID=2585200 RepID=A0A7K0C751_9ACTN|nr:LysR family transcriptional regulator [Actinomadura macrotermitis]MQY08932.1 Hca operon transcriptional activator HcaR [Actinomadura macrotermitis]
MDELAGIEIRHLRYFAAVAQEGTVTGAARRLRIAQPSLSQQIGALERRVGTPLFHRRPQGMELTESGRVLLEGVDRALGGLRSSIAAARGTVREVRLGVCSGVPDAVLARAEALIAGAGPLRPAIEQISSRDQERLLRSGELDFGLLRPPAARAVLTLHLVSDEPLGIVLAPDHPLAGRTALTWDDLAGRRLLWFPSARAPDYAAAVLAALEANGWTPELVTGGHSSHTLFRHALRRDTGLVALRPRHAVGEDSGLAWRPVGPNPPRERLALAALRNGPYARMIDY